MGTIKTVLSNFKLSELNLPHVKYNDIIDIIFVAFLIYQLVIWIKETRAWTLFKGIMIILVFSAIATVLRLNTILWILSNALSVGIIAVVVLFQPEMRKALEQIGKGRFLASVIPQSTASDEAKCSEASFDAILVAVKRMSLVKTGALILIERDVPLGDIINTGIKIDAEISTQLLINIFEHNTPLHDGATVIHNNRIMASTCFLPLTESKLSMELGTRHRAAVGASEVSDAFVIVASEETGSISVATGGKLYRDLSTDKIKGMFFNERKAPKKRTLLKGSRKSG